MAAIPFDGDEFRFQALLLPSLDEMRAYLPGNLVHDDYEQDMLGLQAFNLNSPLDHHTPSSSLQAVASVGGSGGTSERAKSSGSRARFSHRVSDQSRVRAGFGMESGSSLSPDDNFILTPTSTLLDYPCADDEDDGGDRHGFRSSISPAMSHATDTDFEGAPRFTSRAESASVTRTNRERTQVSIGNSGASRASSIAASASFSSETNFQGLQWNSFPAATTGYIGHAGANNHSDLFSYLTGGYDSGDARFPTAGQLDDDLLPSGHSFSDVSMASFDQSLSLSSTGDQMLAQNAYAGEPSMTRLSYYQHQGHHGQYNVVAEQQVHAPYPATQVSLTRHAPDGNLYPRLIVPSTSRAQQRNAMRTAPPQLEHAQSLSSQTRALQHVVHLPMHTTHADEAKLYSQPSPSSMQSSTTHQMRQKQSASSPRSPSQPRASAAPTPRQLPTIAKADPSIVVSNYTPRRPPRSDKGRRGGRQKNSHLAEEARQKTHKMRKISACWKCALQRDPCGEGTPCRRCMMGPQRAGAFFLDCNRSKLPDFMHDFLPPSMTLTHQKQPIEDCVTAQVLEWDLDHPIDVYLTSGYGPALMWRLYEFRPKSDELLRQLQYLQDPATGKSQRLHKYSPPLGLLKLDESDSAYFEEYLNQLMDKEYLWEFGWTCFEEETQVDPDSFQANLMDFICQLYVRTTDIDLRDLLGKIIRMMIITYIMGHTLTILQDTLPNVLNSFRLSPRPNQYSQHTSPKLANRQIKFFFSWLRSNIYEKLLRWQQQTLHTSGKKETTWLPVFCAMLGFAMVLEEVQRTIHIQADAKIAKRESRADDANTEAFNACDRIDGRFKLMVAIFQCKYRDRKWGEHGSFGPGTPEFNDPASKDFLKKLRDLVEEKREHLERRRDVTCAPENQCQYTSRLVARFLLPFLDLPAS